MKEGMLQRLAAEHAHDGTCDAHYAQYGRDGVRSDWAGRPFCDSFNERVLDVHPSAFGGLVTISRAAIVAPRFYSQYHKRR